MSHFPQPVSAATDSFTRVLVEPWQYRFQMRGSTYKIQLASGIEYEPSIPTWAESVVPEDRLLQASLPHDAIYKAQGRLDGPDYDVLQTKWEGVWHPRPNVSRKFADDLFRKILRDLDVSGWRIWLAYNAVRWFGQPAWDEKDDFELPKR